MAFKDIMNRISFGGQVKYSEARAVSTFYQLGQAVMSPENYESYSVFGYSQTPVVYDAIGKVTGAAKGIRWVVYKKKKGGKKRVEIEDGPLVELLSRPNPMQGLPDLIESIIGFYLISGNTYLEGIRVGKEFTELWPMRPDRMEIKVGSKGYPAAYVYKDNGREKVFPCDFINLKSNVLHMKTFHPTDMWYGLAPMRLALMNIDQLRAANKWNLSMMQNSATPSGVLTQKPTDANPLGMLTEESRKNLREEIDSAYTQSKRNGRPMILEGGLSWQTISLSMRDMEYAKSKELSAAEIYAIFGVPLELVGMGQKTFANYAEARESFYQETVLPLLDKLKGELNRWLVPAFGEDLEMDYDLDDVEALSGVRNRKFTTVSAINFLTQNEKRSAVGYEEKEGWDVFVIGQTVGALPEDFAGSAGSQGQDDSDRSDENDDTSNGSDDTDESDDSEDETEVENQDDEETDDTEKPKKSGKVFNPITKNDIKLTWKRQNALRKNLEKGMKRDVERELNDFNKLMAKEIAGYYIKNKTYPDFHWMFFATIDSQLKGTISKYIRWTMEDFSQFIFEDAKSLSVVNAHVETKANRRFVDFAKKYIDERTAAAVTEIERTSIKKAQALIKKLVEEALGSEELDGESLEKELLKTFDSLTPSRASTIARTEVGMASTQGSLEAVKSMQIPNMEKGWVSAKDNRVRDGGDDGNHANHEVMDDVWVPLDEKFAVPPDADMDGPGDPAGGAEQVINCRCVLVYRSRN